MRLIDADKGLISKIQRETGCNFITAQKIVDSMPTEEERKVGKWIDYWGDKTEPDGETWWSGCKCSVCGIFIKNHYNYCPKCGAEMRGSENDI